MQRDRGELASLYTTGSVRGSVRGFWPRSSQLTRVPPCQNKGLEPRKALDAFTDAFLPLGGVLGHLVLLDSTWWHREVLERLLNPW